MIIVQTPLRVSFFGGGTDFPGFYRAEGGAVLTTAIDKYIFVTVKRRFDRKLRVGYTKTEMVDSLDEIQHELIREALRMMGVTEGVEVTTMGDIPSAGSGLGSSSTVTVGALHALHSLRGELVSAETLAQQACEIEIDVLGKPIGVQDQYIAAYGGLRLMEFHKEGLQHRELILDRAAPNENTMPSRCHAPCGNDPDSSRKTSRTIAVPCEMKGWPIRRAMRCWPAQWIRSASCCTRAGS